MNSCIYNGVITHSRFKPVKHFLKYKTFIAERMLQKRFLASSAVYMSTSHDNNILKKYEECLDEIFYQISKCENGSLNIDYILKSKVVKIPFGRIN